MSTSPPPAAYESMATPPEERPAKRQKTLACGRCRRRKQKCDEQRPCTNCSKSGEMCHEVVPRLGLGTIPYAQMALPSPVDISSLEERVAKLEKAQVLAQHWQPNQKPTGNPSHGGYYRGVPSPEGTFTSTNSPTNHGTSPCVYSCHGSPNASLGAFQTRGSGAGQPLQFSGSPGGVAGQDCAQRPGSSLSGSAPAIGLLATFARPDGNKYHGSPQQQLHSLSMNVDRPTEIALFEVYRTRIHSRFAFLDLESLNDPLRRANDPWVGYFTNMVYSIGMLLNGQQSHLAFYRLAVTRHLSHVFAQPDRILHVQAHLLLAMHALHSPSTERLVSIAGATMRYCVLAGLHVGEDDDQERDDSTLGNNGRVDREANKIQLRRRVFWSAYALDRVVSTTFDLPPAVSDGHIATELYNDEADTALMYAKGLRLHSKALGFRLCQQKNSEEDMRLLKELQDWGESCRQYFPAAEWLQLTYHVGVATLFGSELRSKDTSTPAASKGEDAGDEDDNSNSITVAVTPQSSGGSVGDSENERQQVTATAEQDSDLVLNKNRITRDSTTQACLLFRHLQRSTAAEGSERSWLALIAQFKCGVSLLHRSQQPGSRSLREDGDLAQAISACSASLSALARHWPQSRCLSEVFSLVLSESHFGGGSQESRGNSKGKRARDTQDDPSKSVADWLPTLESIVMHRPTLKIIRSLALKKALPTPRSGSCVNNEPGTSRGSDEVTTSSILKLETPSSVIGDEEDGTREEPFFALGLDGREDDGIFRAASPTFFLPDPPRPAAEMPERDYRFDYLDLGGTDDPIVPFGPSLQI